MALLILLVCFVSGNVQCTQIFAATTDSLSYLLFALWRVCRTILLNPESYSYQVKTPFSFCVCSLPRLMSAFPLLTWRTTQVSDPHSDDVRPPETKRATKKREKRVEQKSEEVRRKWSVTENQPCRKCNVEWAYEIQIQTQGQAQLYALYITEQCCSLAPFTQSTDYVKFFIPPLTADNTYVVHHEAEVVNQADTTQ